MKEKSEHFNVILSLRIILHLESDVISISRYLPVTFYKEYIQSYPKKIGKGDFLI